MSDDTERLLEKQMIETLDWTLINNDRLRVDWCRARRLRKWGCVDFEKQYKRVKSLAN